MPMSQEMLDLQAQINTTTSVIGSAIQLINGFSARLRAIAEAKDAEIRHQITEFAYELDMHSDALAEAVAANTEPTPPAE